jgi:hypothetical protein
MKEHDFACDYACVLDLHCNIKGRTETEGVWKRVVRLFGPKGDEVAAGWREHHWEDQDVGGWTILR